MSKETKSNVRKPLGYIQLETGEKAVPVMSDIFLNYHFEKEEHWEDLRSLVNIFTNDFTAKYPNTVAKPINGAIDVQTQYQFLLNSKNKTRNQDIKVIGEKLTYIEFQNRANTVPPIEVRAPEYFGLGIGHSGGKISNQIWLLAEDVESVLHGKMYANYVLVDEVTNTKYPKQSGLMFVSLTKIAEQDSQAGELASFLLGRITDVGKIKDADVRRIASGFKTNFSVFKEDKEAKNVMTVQERFLNEGIVKGIDKGIDKGIVDSAEKLIKKGTSFQDAINLLELTDEQIDSLNVRLGHVGVQT